MTAVLRDEPLRDELIAEADVDVARFFHRQAERRAALIGHDLAAPAVVLVVPAPLHGDQIGMAEAGDTVKYQIVGEDEADLKQGLINISSPIARALIGKEEGDTAEVQAPGGVRRYEIVGVSYV